MRLVSLHLYLHMNKELSYAYKHTCMQSTHNIIFTDRHLHIKRKNKYINYFSFQDAYNIVTMICSGFNVFITVIDMLNLYLTVLATAQFNKYLNKEIILFLF